MADLYLLIGGNQGDRVALLQRATDLIQERIGSVAYLSHIYETAPWGNFGSDQHPQNFLNMALAVHTQLTPQVALAQALAIEKELGRERTYSEPTAKVERIYSSRPIDIDLIFYDDQVINTDNLEIPHPRMHLRRFVLQPLCDIAPDYMHPIYHKTLIQLLQECPDESLCSYWH